MHMEPIEQVMVAAPEILACRRASNRRTSLILFLALVFIILMINSSHQKSPPDHHNHHHMRYESPPADVKPAPYRNVPILIPNLPPNHYQYWLKNHPLAAGVFGKVCDQAHDKLADLNDLAEFTKLHSDLYFEDPDYTGNLDYGKRVLGSVCSKIKDVSKSCWGYENNCQDIYLMPECTQNNSSQSKSDEQEQKITWFNQADFGYILDRARERQKYCSPNKKDNPTEVSTLECIKHFTSCRGRNLYMHFNPSGLLTQRLSAKLTKLPPVVSEVGGWGCDLQLTRIKEEAGRDGWLESWHGELKDYKRVDSLKPTENCDLTEEQQVFFVKLGSTNNLYDYLGSFINLYASIHMNNRFSENNRIIIWNTHLPRSKTFSSLWYAFSKLPPESLGGYNGKKVCFKNFIFALPPKMRDGLHADKSLVEGCSKSGLYNAFHKHIIHRLKVRDLYDLNYHRKSENQLLRISILSRASETEFRNIINENELEKTIRNLSSNYYVQVLKYNSLDFGHVLMNSLNSDIMIGLHGTGLAYSLFLPDWAGLIELHDCGNNRYHNLARLRGISYFKPTDLGNEPNLVRKVRVSEQAAQWSQLNQSRLLDHDEYSNYEVNLERFKELFDRAASHVYSARKDYFEQQDVLDSKRPAVTTARKVAVSTVANIEPSAAPQNTESTSTETSTTTTTSAPTSTTTSAPTSTTIASVPTSIATSAPSQDPTVSVRDETKDPGHNEL